MGQTRSTWTHDGPAGSPQNDDSVARLARIASLWSALQLTKTGSLEYHSLITRIRTEADAFKLTRAQPRVTDPLSDRRLSSDSKRLGSIQ